MIKIVFYAHEWDVAGTSQCLMNVMEVLDRSQFEPYALYWDACTTNTQLDKIKGFIGADHVIPFQRSPQKSGEEQGYTPLTDNFSEVVGSIKPGIIHVARAGYYEWPLNKRMAPVQVETNVFGYRDESGYLDRSLCISRYVSDRRGPGSQFLYIPVPADKTGGENLRDLYHFKDTDIACGRIGRPGNFDPIAMEAFRRVSVGRSDLKYLIVNPCEHAGGCAGADPNIIFVPGNKDDIFVDKFFNTLDILCHYRYGGEMFGVAIAEAMMHGVPVISHYSTICNAHPEVIGMGGSVVRSVDEYAAVLQTYVEQPSLRVQVGAIAADRALNYFNQDIVVGVLERLYRKWVLP